MTPLELASTDQLINELFSRHEAAIFYCRSARPDQRREEESLPPVIFSYRRKGDLQTCIGMAMTIVHYCMDDMDEIEEAISPDDI